MLNRAIIRQALLDLDYKENKVAKILAKGKTDIVGVLLPNMYLHYFSEMLSQILATYEEFGYQFLVTLLESVRDVLEENKSKYGHTVLIRCKF